MSNIRTSLPIPTEPWEAAKARFLENLPPEEKSLFENATLENVFFGASVANKKHTQSRSWLLQERLSSIVDAIDDYTKALDVFSNTSSLVCCPLWGGLRVILHIAGEAGRFQKNLVDMLAQIGDTLPRFGIYQVLFKNHERLAVALSSVYLDVLHFCVATKDFFTRARQSMIPLSIVVMGAWRAQRQHFDEHIVNFRLHSKRVEKEARAAHMIESAKSREIQLANRALQIKNGKIQKRHQMLASLPAVDYVAKHFLTSSYRYPGTNEWVQTVPEYLSWKSDPVSSCLCCYGIPGSGKSVLCASLVDKLHEQCHQEDSQTHSDGSKSLVCYYYCDYSDKDSLQSLAILGSIIKQVLVALPLDCFEEEFDCPLTDKNLLGGIHKAVKYLQTLFKRFKVIYLLFDGVDQLTSDGQSFVLDMIRTLMQETLSNLKVFITSRSEEYLIKTTLQHFQSLQLSYSTVKKDIGTYVRARIELLSNNRNPLLQNQALKEDVIESLCVGAQDMFLWVQFQLHEVAEALTETALRSAVHNFPRSLAETYRRILDKIYRAVERCRCHPVVLLVFLWLRGARRPLKLDELEEAIGLDPNDTCLPTERIARNAGQRLVSLCCNLVVHYKEDNTVMFAHHTVQQFFDSLVSISTDTEESHPWGQLLQRINAEQYIARVCIAYLSFTDFETAVVRSATPMNVEKEQIEKYVWGDIPMAQSVKTLLKWAKSGRNDTALRPIRLHVPMTTRPSDMLAKRYLMLDYIVANWAFHTETLGTVDSEVWHTIVTLVCHKDLTFNFRPWHDPEHNIWTHQSILAYSRAWSKRRDHHHETEAENLMTGTSSADLLLYSWCMKHGVRFPLKFLHVDLLMPYIKLLSEADGSRSNMRPARTFWNAQNPTFAACGQFINIVLQTTPAGANFWTGDLLLNSRNGGTATLDFAIREYVLWSGTTKPGLEDLVCEGAALAMRLTNPRQPDMEGFLDHLNLLGWNSCYKLLTLLVVMKKDIPEEYLRKILKSPVFYAWKSREQYQRLLFALYEVRESLPVQPHSPYMLHSMKEAVVPILLIQGRPSLLDILPKLFPDLIPFTMSFPPVDWTNFEFGNEPLYDQLRSLDGRPVFDEASKIYTLWSDFKALKEIHSEGGSLQNIMRSLAAYGYLFNAEHFENDGIHCLRWAFERRSVELVNKLSPYYLHLVHLRERNKITDDLIAMALRLNFSQFDPMKITGRHAELCFMKSALLALASREDFQYIAGTLLMGITEQSWMENVRGIEPREMDSRYQQGVIEGDEKEVWSKTLQYGFEALRDQYESDETATFNTSQEL